MAVEALSNRILEDVALMPARWATLIPVLPHLYPSAVDRAIRQLQELAAQLPDGDVRVTVWEQVRDLVSLHRSHPEARWALSSQVLDRLEDAANSLFPEDAIARYRWLFASPVTLPVRFEVFDEELRRMRINAVRELLARGGAEGVLAFAEAVQLPGEVGDAMYSVGLDKAVTEQVLAALTDPRENRSSMARGFLWRAVRNGGEAWIQEFLSFERMSSWNEDAQAAALLTLPLSAATLDRIDHMPTGVQERYWRGSAHLFTDDPGVFVRGVERLLHHRRPRLALRHLAMSSYVTDSLLSPPLVHAALLESLNTRMEEDPTHIEPHHVERLLGWLLKHPDVDPQLLAQLEWLYIPFLRFDDPHLSLHDRLSADPAFFVEVVGILGSRHAPDSEPKANDEDMIDRAFWLLESWKQVPGLCDAGTLDEGHLKQWVAKAMSLLEAARLRDEGLNIVGKLLPWGPREHDGTWPAPAICDVIQDLASVRLDESFRIAVYNSRGTSVRGPFEGGGQERELAEKYEGYARNLSANWPRVAAIMRKIAREYRDEAASEDNDAELDEDRLG